MKLLNRLYETTEGEIIIDGTSINDYKVEDLRRAATDLSQDHHIFPLTVRENIGLGLPHSITDIEMVKDAAKKGGALGFVEKFAEGFETVIHPVRTVRMMRDSPDVRELWKKLEKSVEISGMKTFG